MARFFKVPMESLLLDPGGNEEGVSVPGEVAPNSQRTIQSAEMLRAAGRIRELAKGLCAEAERLEQVGGNSGRVD